MLCHSHFPKMISNCDFILCMENSQRIILIGKTDTHLFVLNIAKLLQEMLQGSCKV